MVRRTWSRDPFTQWREEVERFFSQQFPNVSERNGNRGADDPAVNLWESESALTAEMELPGVAEADLEVQVLGDELTISGKRVAPADSQVFHSRERKSGDFKRTIRLPVDVDAGKVEATLRDGVLVVSLPKAEAAKPRKIEVQASK